MPRWLLSFENASLPVPLLSSPRLPTCEQRPYSGSLISSGKTPVQDLLKAQTTNSCAQWLKRMSGTDPSRLDRDQVPEAAARLAAIVASSCDAIVSKALDGTVTSWNEGATLLFGYTEEEMIGQSIRRVIPADRQEEEEVILAQIASGQVVKPYETFRVHKDGRQIPVSVTVSPIRNAAGIITGASKIARDITEYKQAQKKLADSEARFRATFENAAVGIGHVAPDGSWLLVNNRLCEITGYSAEELCGKNFQAITHREDLGADLASVQRMLSGGIDSYGMEKRYLRKDGSIVWVRLRVGCVRKDDGAVDYFISVVADISEQKRAEIALRESEEGLRLANKAAGIGIFTLDLQRNRVFYSPELAGILGIPGVEAESIEAAFARVHRDDVPKARELYDGAVRGENGSHMETNFRFLHPSGQTRWMSWIGRAEFREGPHGREPFRFVGACLDVTERKRQEEHISVLMREVNHRSKNMLAVVQAIARQTLATSPSEFVERFGDRVRALAASQDLLIESAWRGVELHELVISQLSHLKDLVDSRIELKGQPLQISASAAQVIGMAVHELATNAVKYGALSNDTGRIEISWSLEPGDAAGESFEMSWRESGGFCSCYLTPQARLRLNCALQGGEGKPRCRS